ncbi:hypothetical protein PCANC_16070 [Puccinia coronata f. sp. avenae]|uniref:MPN domain-containing protein n=1 Tax=Puccinia coronata f. sp. avenae TaxID=200324 RepID=A0A2N5UA41_9BASI|nr:hypothetical protein PCANC_16070 [Puccinia coronata f. sp. avenae]
MASPPTTAPRSVEQLQEMAQVAFDCRLPIRSYVRSCEMLFQQANIHQPTDLDLAFIYLFRAAKIIVHDLPSHPEYPLLPPAYRSQIEADGIKYLDAMVPIKAKLVHRHNQYLHKKSTSKIHSHAILSRSTHNSHLPPHSPSYPPQSQSTSFSLQHACPPLAPSSSPPSLLSTPTLSASFNHSADSSTSFPSTSSILNTPPQPTPDPNAEHPHHHHDASDPSLADWTLVDSPPYDSVRKTWQQPSNGKHKAYHHHHHRTSGPNTHCSSSKTSLSSAASSTHQKPAERNPLVWPVELGNGQGQRMSVALSPDQPIPSWQSSSCPHGQRRRDSSRAQSPQASQRPSIKEQHHAPRVAFRHQALYDLADPSTPSGASGRQNPSTTTRTTHLGLERPGLGSRATTSVHDSPPKPAKKSPFSFGRFALSSENLGGVSSQHEPQPAASSALKALLQHRPRRLSLTSYPAKLKRRESLGSWASVSVPTSPSDDPGPAPPPPPPPPPPTSSGRARRGSLGESSTWRWLKGLTIKPAGGGSGGGHGKPPPCVQASSLGSSLYTDLPSSSAPATTATQPAASLAPAAPIISASARPTRPAPARPLPPLVPRKLPRTHTSQIEFPSDTAHPSAIVAPDRPSPRRPMRCPNDLVGAFVAMAEPQTQQGIELCGLLLGNLRAGELVVDTLLIPKQVSTADTCHTIDEAATFEFQSARGLMTLGWIHTHPTQTCFMSSVDLHTHLSYQLMLPEAVAIVCSPHKTPSVGVYTLIDPAGVDTIRSCRQPGAFHPHAVADGQIYTSPPLAHFALVDQLPNLLDTRMALDIVDLRGS